MSSQTCSGDTRGCQKAKIVHVYYIKNDDFHLKQPNILYNSLYINTIKKLHATSRACHMGLKHPFYVRIDFH